MQSKTYDFFYKESIWESFIYKTNIVALTTFSNITSQISKLIIMWHKNTRQILLGDGKILMI